MKRDVQYTADGKVLTRAGIVIGGAYQPPPHPMGAHAETIQRWLLDGRPVRTEHWILTVMNHPLRWPAVFVAAAAIGALLGFAKRAGLF